MSRAIRRCALCAPPLAVALLLLTAAAGGRAVRMRDQPAVHRRQGRRRGRVLGRRRCDHRAGEVGARRARARDRVGLDAVGRDRHATGRRRARAADRDGRVPAAEPARVHDRAGGAVHAARRRADRLPRAQGRAAARPRPLPGDLRAGVGRGGGRGERADRRVRPDGVLVHRPGQRRIRVRRSPREPARPRDRGTAARGGSAGRVHGRAGGDGHDGVHRDRARDHRVPRDGDPDHADAGPRRDAGVARGDAAARRRVLEHRDGAAVVPQGLGVADRVRAVQARGRDRVRGGVRSRRPAGRARAAGRGDDAGARDPGAARAAAVRGARDQRARGRGRLGSDARRGGGRRDRDADADRRGAGRRKRPRAPTANRRTAAAPQARRSPAPGVPPGRPARTAAARRAPPASDGQAGGAGSQAAAGPSSGVASGASGRAERLLAAEARGSGAGGGQRRARRSAVRVLARRVAAGGCGSGRSGVRGRQAGGPGGG